MDGNASQPTFMEGTCFLFVPGDRPERFDRAELAGASAVIFDLEASVLPERKKEARGNLARRLAQPSSCHRVVRINPRSSPWFEEDTALLREHPCDGVMLAMTHSPEDLAAARRLLPPGVAVLALIESAAGVVNAHAIASCGEAARIAFGNMDYHTQIGSTAREALVYPSSVLVVASHAAGLPPPLAGVTPAVRDLAAIRADLAFERALGFGGKMCIHPQQVEPILHAFRPSEDEVAWARRVLAATADSHAVEVDGELVDRPVVERARRLLARLPGGNQR